MAAMPEANTSPLSAFSWIASRSSTVSKHLLATGDLDEFRDPANAGGERIVPFLEINLRLPSPANRHRHLVKASFVPPGKRFCLVQRSDQSANGANHRENAGD